MSRIRWAPVLFAAAIALMVLPLLKFTIVPSEATIEQMPGLSETGLQSVEIPISLNALEVFQIANGGADADFEELTQTYKDVEPLDLGEEPTADAVAREVTALYTKELKPTLILSGNFLLTDGDLIDDLEKAKDEQAEAMLTAVQEARSAFTYLSYALILGGVAMLAGIILGLVNIPMAPRLSMIAGAAGVAGFGAAAYLANAEFEAAYWVYDAVIKVQPDFGLWGATAAAAVGTFFAYQAQSDTAPSTVSMHSPQPMVTPAQPVAVPTAETAAQPVSAATVETEAAFVPSPAPGSAMGAPVPGLQAQPAAAQQTVMASPAGQPAWGATVIEEAPGAAQSVFASMRVVAGNGTGRSFDVRAGGETRIGRDASMNDIVIADGKASGQHAKIRYEDERFTLFDLGSTNGTFVNEQRVGAPVVLAPEDRLKIGDTILVFQLVSA